MCGWTMAAAAIAFQLAMPPRVLPSLPSILVCDKPAFWLLENTC
jgi:hypothetical protein